VTILSVAYPLIPVGPDASGGAEQILFLVERAIAAAGHDSIVIAAAGSQVSGTLIPTPLMKGEITDDVRRQAQQIHQRCIEQSLDEQSIDLIHFHGLDFYSYQPASAVPKLATLHLPLAWYPDSIFSRHDIALNCVSDSQARTAPDSSPLSVILNGIDLDCYNKPRGTKEFLLWFGRICPEKGTHIALEIAHRLNLPMVVAGPVHPFRDHQVYFSSRVEPLLDSEHRYIGPIGLEQKTQLLAEARCLLIPSLAPETSSLAAMEAISSGTPVVAFRSGALPEVVEDGLTGFIADSEDEMAAAVAKTDSISTEVCRERARLRFDARRMANDYRCLYERVIRMRHLEIDSAPHKNL